MQTKMTGYACAMVLGATVFGGATLAQNNSDGHSHDHDHGHDHASDEAHAHGDADIYAGYFEDSQIEERPLSNWGGDWQSVYPYLQDGILAPVMEHKAEEGEMTAEEYTKYYETGYETDVDRIVIDSGMVTFHRGDETTQGEYADGGYEILNYDAGNRGVRYIFEKVDGDEAAPGFIQFSDHGITSMDAGHYHLYWGDDRETVLEELTNWPTYYPSSMGAEQIVSEMMAH